MKKASVVPVSILISVGLLFSGIAPATADGESSVDLSNAAGVIDRFVPKFLEQTALPASGQSIKVTAESRRPSTAGSHKYAPLPLVKGSPRISITPLGAAPESTQQGHLDVLGMSESVDKTYVQPLANGVRMLSTIAAESSPNVFSYAIDSPAGTTAVHESDGGIKLLDSDGVPIGSFTPPWALDSSGRELPTKYTWESGKLTQHVDTSGKVDYPVLADPQWGYTFIFRDLHPTKSPKDVKDLLNGCFNCYFPISGAPAAFPSPTQVLPLTVGGLNFTCSFVGETGFFPYDHNWGYEFRTLEGHVDGVGSRISFGFTRIAGTDANGNLLVSKPLYLSVDATIVGGAGAELSYEAAWAYRQMAGGSWHTFASRVSEALTGTTYGGSTESFIYYPGYGGW